MWAGDNAPSGQGGSARWGGQLSSCAGGWQLHGAAGVAGPWPTSRPAGQREGVQAVQPRSRATAWFGFKRSCAMRRLIFGVFSSRSSEIAKLAKAASRRGSVPLRMRLWSSRKATSRTQWMRFSIPQ